MGDGAAYNYLAMQQAIADAGLEASEVSTPRTGLIMGSGGPSTSNMMTAFDTAREKGPKRVGPSMVPRTMSSTNSACLSTSSEEHTSELQSLMRISYAVFCLNKTQPHSTDHCVHYHKIDLLLTEYR